MTSLGPHLLPRGSVVPAVVGLLLVAGLAMLLRYPPLSDVTTTPEDPPAFRVDPPGEVAYRASRADLQRRAYPDLTPLARRTGVSETFVQALEAARAMPGWTIVFQSDSAAVLQAAVATGVSGSTADVVVEVRRAGSGSEVHVRSRSGLGRVDFGANAQRIRSYLSTIH